MKKIKELYLKLFHNHNFKLVKWMLVHYPNHEPSRRIYLLECEDCGKKKNICLVKNAINFGNARWKISMDSGLAQNWIINR